MSKEFENILETAMNFVKAAGELIENAKESFDALKDMKKVFQDVQENQLEDPIIEDACILVLFKGVIAQLCFAASLSKTVQEIEPLESQLPQSLQPKTRVIRDHLHSIREKLKEIQATMTEMRTMASKCLLKKQRDLSGSVSYLVLVSTFLWRDIEAARDS